MRRKVLCMLLAALFVFSGCSVFQKETPASTKTSTQVAYQGNLLLGLSADGSITLPVTGLDFAVSGIIKNIYVSAGDMVKKGDLLADLDDTDLQLALVTAQNNLDKAVLAYEEAVATAAYNQQSEMLSIESTKRQLETPFDEYTYQLAVDNAKLNVSRKKQDLADMELSTQLSEEAARLTLSRKQAELATAQADYQAALTDEAEPFDEFTYQNNIKSAQTTVDRALVTLNDANQALKDTKRNNREDLYSDDPSLVLSAKEKIAAAEKTVYNAENSYNDALDALELAKTNRDRDFASHDADEAERLKNALEAAAKTLESAQQAVDDAQTALNNTIIDNTQKLITSRQSLTDAETSLQNAEEDLARGRSSFEEDKQEAQSNYELQLLKLDNLSSSDSAIKNAQYNIEEAKNALASAENDLAKVRITAPIDGEVLNITKKEGEKVTENEGGPGIFMGSGNTSSSFMTIRDLSSIYMTARIPEGDIVGLAVGQKIRVAVDALGEENIMATVYSISSIPNADSSGIITYEVIGVLDEMNPEIRDSMSVFLTFIKREKMDVLLIPNKSVFMENSQQYVYVQKEDGSLEKRAVTCGLSNGTQTEVIEGLTAGETVIVGKVNV